MNENFSQTREVKTGTPPSPPRPPPVPRPAMLHRSVTLTLSAIDQHAPFSVARVDFNSSHRSSASPPPRGGRRAARGGDARPLRQTGGGAQDRERGCDRVSGSITCLRCEASRSLFVSFRPLYEYLPTLTSDVVNKP